MQKEAVIETIASDTLGASGESRGGPSDAIEKVRAIAASAMMHELRRVALGDRVTRLTLRSELRVVCTQAKSANLRAEQLVILFKNIWNGIPEMRIHLGPAAAQSVLNHIVTTALDEFYSVSARPD